MFIASWPSFKNNFLLSLLLGLISITPLYAQSNAPILPNTVAEKRLQAIQSKEATFYNKVEQNSNPLPQSEKLRLAEEIANDYRSFLQDNPNHLYGYILLGKFLRQINQKDSANQAFLKANAIDPKIPVVKQQIGNYLAEIGDYGLALPYFLNAIELAPEEPLYHYQLGELLDTFKEDFIKDQIMDYAQLDFQMLKAFQKASQLAPNSRELQLRYAQAFFDLHEPQWGRAIAAWNALIKNTKDPYETDYIRFNQARILTAMERYTEATQLLSMIKAKALQENVQKLQKAIQDKQPQLKLNK